MAKRKSHHEKLVDLLKAWAVTNGAEVQALTNPYELMRVRVNGGVAIVWKKDNGKQTWNVLAQQLRTAFEQGEPFPSSLRLVEKVEQDWIPGQNGVIHRTLIERDGLGCFFCFEEVTGQMTQEHLVPRTHGGPNHLSNKFRACEPCNMKVGHLSAPEKIRIREAALLARKLPAAASEEHF